MKFKDRWILLSLVSMAIVSAIFAALAIRPVLFPPEPTPAPYHVYGSLVIGAIHVGARDDHGYNQVHSEALAAVTANFDDVRLLEVDKVPEDDTARQTMEDMIAQGANVIAAQSYGYFPYIQELAKKYPAVIFLHPAGPAIAHNIMTYWVLSHEGMYLAGIAAGSATKTGKLGFIAAFPIPVIVSSANAFLLGARLVRPDATLQFVTTSDWVDPEAEFRIASSLIDNGVDVLTMIVDSPVTIVKTAEERGVYVVGYHSASLQQFAPNGWLTGAANDWTTFYVRTIREIHAGEWQPALVRGGLESGMIALAPFGKNVSRETISLIEVIQSELRRGQRQVFAGSLWDNAGIPRVAEGDFIGIEALDTMDWFVAGVQQ